MTFNLFHWNDTSSKAEKGGLETQQKVGWMMLVKKTYPVIFNRSDESAVFRYDVFSLLNEERFRTSESESSKS